MTPTEKKLVLVVILIWLWLTAPIPFINTIEPFILGLPILWFWVLLGVIIATVVLTIGYLLLEREEQMSIKK